MTGPENKRSRIRAPSTGPTAAFTPYRWMTGLPIRDDALRVNWLEISSARRGGTVTGRGAASPVNDKPKGELLPRIAAAFQSVRCIPSCLHSGSPDKGAAYVYPYSESAFSDGRT